MVLLLREKEFLVFDGKAESYDKWENLLS